ncbi:hypothetical protein AB1E19_006918 [Capra hircus]
MQNNEIIKPAKYFSELEKSILLALVEKYKYVLECKKSDARTIALKQRTWQALAHEYNSQPSVSLRDFKQLKKCWENIKARTKKIMAHERREKVKRSVSPLLSTHVLGKEKIASMLPEQLYFLQSPPEEEPEYHAEAAAQESFAVSNRELCDDEKEFIHFPGHVFGACSAPAGPRWLDRRAAAPPSPRQCSRPAAGTIAPPEAAPAAGGGGAAGAGARGVRGAGSQPPLPPAALSRAPHRAGRGLCDAAATAADTKGRRGVERGAGPAPAPRPPPAARARPLVPRHRSPRAGSPARAHSPRPSDSVPSAAGPGLAGAAGGAGMLRGRSPAQRHGC